MDAERWARIEALFEGAMRLPEAARDAFVARAAADEDLRAEVRSLLSHHSIDAPFHEEALGKVAAKWARADVETAGATLVGRRLGPYEVTGIAGRGGMGAVYRARRADGEFDQDVAIKLIRQGFETPLALERFRQERQILARLAHTAIGRLLDGGTVTDESGDDAPYLVMEYVDGEPITAYCTSQRLSVHGRLRLFRLVCDGVQHAHQQLIVHRDIKPGNILVTPDGHPKLLDFGIAKLLIEDAALPSARTSTGMQALTPDYASPEQVKGEPATAATDIYSLGAVLYELLTGQKVHQFQSLSPVEIGRVVCEAETTRPSEAVTPTTPGAAKLRRQLEGDLDMILLKALRKEPARRYPSVEQFSEDIRRHLAGMPVLARPDTVTYRAGKFLRRNRFTLAAAALATASLVGGTVVSLWQARRAERRFDQVRRLANALIYDVHDEIRDLTGSTKARQKIVSTGLEYLDGLQRETAGDAGLEQDMAAAYLRIADVQGGVLASNLGDVKGALESYRKARALLEVRLKPDATPLSSVAAFWSSVASAFGRTSSLDASSAFSRTVDADAARQVAAVDVKIGDALSYHGDLPGAVAAYSGAKSLMEPVTARGDTRPEDLQQLAAVLQAMARVQGLMRDMEGALASSQRVLAIRRSLAENDRANGAWRDSLAGAEAEVSMALQRMARPAEALPHARQALAVREARATAEPNNVAAQRGLILAYSHVADVLGNPTMPSLGDTAGAIDLYRRMTAVAERLVAGDASDRRATLDLANCLLRLGSALLASPESGEGLERLERSAALMRTLAEAEPKNNRVRITLAFVYGRLGDAWAANNRAVPALANYRQAIRVSEAVLAADPSEASITATLAVVHGGQGLTLAKTGARDAALKSGLRGIEVLERALATQPGNPRTLSAVAAGYAVMGRIHRRLGASNDGAQACSWFVKSREAYSEAEGRAPLDPVNAADRDEVAQQLATCGRRL